MVEAPPRPEAEAVTPRREPEVSPRLEVEAVALRPVVGAESPNTTFLKSIKCNRVALINYGI